MILNKVVKYSIIKTLSLGIIWWLTGFSLDAQNSGIKFRDDYWLEKAIQIAQIEDKNIFIDTYAPWCGPCKLMDFQFLDEDLGAYFNEKYINIKIDMDGPYGPAIKKAYDVFFLPTLLILDKYGNVKYASQGALTSNELLAIGSHHHDEIYNAENVSEQAIFETKVSKNVEQKEVKKEMASAPSLNPAPIKQKSKKEEKILYTAKDARKDPDFLYNLTYLKLQLQDGTHWAAADEYLKTQKDWNTKKNMKFIYDFVRSPGTPMFQHIIDNRSRYDILFGQQNVDRSISIMVNMALYQSVLRPNREEAIKLFKILDEGIAEQAALNYMLERFEREEQADKYLELAEEYIGKYGTDDFDIINNMVSFQYKTNYAFSLSKLENWVLEAIDKQGGTYYKLYESLALIYLQEGKKRKASKAIEQAKELAKNSGMVLSHLEHLEKLIQSL